MRFLADMGVSMRVVEWLRASGHDAVHLHDEGLQKLPNGEIFQKAIREQRIVVTFDLDFGEIVAASAGRSVSVILFRVRNTRADFVVKRLKAVLVRAAHVSDIRDIVLHHDLATAGAIEIADRTNADTRPHLALSHFVRPNGVMTRRF